MKNEEMTCSNCNAVLITEEGKQTQNGVEHQNKARCGGSIFHYLS